MRTCAQRRFRPSLESLDAREMPAALALTWTNAVGNNDFYTPGNWSVAGSTAPRAPEAGDDVTFDGTESSANCINLGVLSGSGGEGGPIGGEGGGEGEGSGATGLHSLRLISGYSGTVTIVAPLQVNTFLLAAASTGAVAQSSSGNDLTITDTFTWTNGVLNNSGVAATVNVLGNGSIAPLNAGTVSLGSTIIFTGTQPAPKETTIDPGTIAFGAVGGGMVIGAFAVVTARTYTDGDIIGLTKNQLGAQEVEIQANGTLWAFGRGIYTSNMPIKNYGAFNLTSLVRATLTGGGGAGYDYIQYANSQFRLENGSSLTVTKMLVDGGTVYLMMNTALPANQQTATINGTFNMSGGNILFSAPIAIGTTPIVYGTFTVNGDVNWTGGTYIPSVDYTTAGLANKWIVNGKMTSAAACIVQPNPQRGANPPASSNWTILQADTTAGTLPTVAVGSTLSLGEFTEATKKVWKLTSP